MSITNEQTKSSVKPLQMEFKDQFRSVLGLFVKEIDDKGYCYISDLDQVIDKDNGMYQFLKDRGIEAKYGIAVKNKNNFVVGFICIEYINKSTADLNKIKKAFSEKQKAVEALLGL